MKTIFFKHRPGDGLHYINDNFKTFENGSFQYGDTSENCVLYYLHIILFRNNLPSLSTLWGTLYPNDFMSDEDLAYIVSSAIPFCHPFKANSIEDIRDVIKDVKTIGCQELAEEVTRLLRERGISV